ncbi:hypothetical protein JCM9279_007682 [Rhodotorula babjevae]
MASAGLARPLRPTSSSTSTSTSSRSLVAIRARHACQYSNALTISSITSLLSDLSSNTSDHHTAQSRDDRVAAFRHDWLLGLLARTRPLDLLPDGHVETYSDGLASPSSSSRRASSIPSVLSTTATTPHEPAAEPSPPLPDDLRSHLVPSDPMSRGVLAEGTIKRALALDHQLVRHHDYASLATAARRAMRLALRSGRPVYLSPGLVDSVDWTDEYRERGWAAPGLRFGVLRPDLVRFEEVRRRGGDDEEGERVVSWEVVEVKWAGKATDFIYNTWKVQAGFYHLTLARLLAPIPSLVPSHKLSFFISHDPLSSAYIERSVALRTSMAFVEHHLFVLVPRWLECVTLGEGQRLQDMLSTAPETPKKGDSTTLIAQQMFLEKLQASIKATPPTPGRPRRRPPSPIKPASSDAPPSSPFPRSDLPFPTSPSLLPAPLPPTPLALDTLPPLPAPTLPEERDLLADWLEQVALS